MVGTTEVAADDDELVTDWEANGPVVEPSHHIFIQGPEADVFVH